MKNKNNSIDNSIDSEQRASIKKLLKEKKLNPKNSEDLKYLLSLTLLPKINKYKFNFNSLISLLLKYKTPKNEEIFYNFFFQSCELGKIKNVKILLKHNLDINKQNEFGETPLHIAIAKNDVELVKLLIQHEPRTDLVTKKDGYSIINYAKICGNNSILKMINELIEKNSKKKIKSEIVDFIQKDMVKIDDNNLSNLNSIVYNNINFDEIENYEGEKISAILNDDSIISNNLSKNINNNKSKKEEKGCNNTSNTLIINDSKIFDDIPPKNTIRISNYNNRKSISNPNVINNIQLPSKTSNLTEIQIFPSPSKKKENSNFNTNSIKSSYLQSLKTSHTLSKEHELSPIYKNKINKFLNKKIELTKFISEINLPKKYAEILIENGFDDLNVLINQMKKGLSITYQNLKDIGITSPGDKSKILVHLEEISQNFDFDLEKDIIYSNNIPEEKNGSLYQFLHGIHLDEYFQLFIDSGFSSAELLFMQMASKNPITEDILKNDIGINKIGHLQRIMISLKEETKKYVDNLRIKSEKSNGKYKSLIFEENPYLNSCEACFIF
jgi:ankyrin repeat protein